MTIQATKQPFTVRLFRPEKDIPAMLDLRVEVEAIDQIGNDTTEESFRATLNWGGHDPSRDRWVAEAPDDPTKFIAYAWVFAQSQERVVTNVVVHPAWRRRGIGSTLVAYTQKRAREYGANHVTGGSFGTDQAASAFLTHHGFVVAGRNRFFKAPADVPLSDVIWPDGYQVRPFADVQDLSVLVAAQNRSYHDMWGHAENVPGAVDEARIAEGLKNSPDYYNPDSIFIAFAPDGDVAGVCYGRMIEFEENDPTRGRPKKVIDSPGVVTEHRHLDLQRPLALTTMYWLRNQQEQGPFELWTFGDSEEVVALYHELGFMLDSHNVLTEYRLSRSKFQVLRENSG
ncbi:GNAT family N-acetyltransferase [Chloroflexi bacterium TSY]|nr:GNAT family N-acetyltransferase [Chloroflexi bacterium TSY]